MTRLASLVPALALVGCGTVVSFDVSQKAQTTIPAGGPVAGVLGGFGFQNLNFSQSSDFQNNNTSKDHVRECRLKQLTLKVVSPPGQDLHFLTKVEFFVEAPNLEKKRIASGTSFPSGVASVDLVPDDLDLAPYVRADSFSITTAATGTSPSQQTTLEADLTLNVHASVL